MRHLSRSATATSPTELDLTDEGPSVRPDWLVAELADLVTVILGHAKLLDAALADPSTARNDVGAIVSAADRAAAVVTRLVAADRGVGQPTG